MPHQTEPSANNALGNILQAMQDKAVVRCRSLASGVMLRGDLFQYWSDQLTR